MRSGRFGALVVLASAIVVLMTGCLEDTDFSLDNEPVRTGTSGRAYPMQLRAAHILIAPGGSMLAPEGVKRTKEEALARARKVAEMAKADDAEFGALAKKYSDCPTSKKGGDLGTFLPVEKAEEFTRATMNLKIGEVSDVVETDLGYHIILRLPLKRVQTASVKHILVRYWGAKDAPLHIARTRAEARERISKCLDRLENGERFEDMVLEYSECPTTRHINGDMGQISEGDLGDEFSRAVFACKVGNFSSIVESAVGFHIVYRYK